MTSLDEILADKEEARRRLLDHKCYAQTVHRRCDICFELTMQFAEAHEFAVAERVRMAGWVCEPWGQALLTRQMRDALRRTESPVRWAPDLLAVRGAEWCFVDAKTERRQDTANFSLEKSAFASHFQWWIGNTKGGAPFIYVWDDFRCSHISDIAQMLNDKRAGAGRYMGSGSGTPFFLIPKAETHPFDSIFGGSEAKSA